MGEGVKISSKKPVTSSLNFVSFLIWLIRFQNNQNFLQQDVALVMWENGFTVDGGPLRRYTDPPNQLFLDAIAEG